MNRLCRLISILAALALLLSASAFAEETARWKYDGNNCVLRVEGTLKGDVIVPANVDGYDVSALDACAFQFQNDVTSITLPSTMHALQDSAISSMDNLTSVTLNDGLEVICNGNFTNCPKLTSLTIPASVRLIESAFFNCDNLREIRFEGVCPVILDRDWFFWCLANDYTVYVPDDQLEAYASALGNANGAVDHLKPSGKNATVVTHDDAEDWYTFDAATGTITGYRAYHAFIDIPASIGGVPVKAIGENAFRYNSYVYAVVLPEGVERVENDGFYHAVNVCHLHLPTTLRSIGDRGFHSARAVNIEWNEGLEEIGEAAFYFSKAKTLQLPSTLITIGDKAFEGSWCGNLYLSGALERIGSRAFANTFLTYMAFDFYQPIDIAPDAFADNKSLADLDLPWDSSVENRDAFAAMLNPQCPGCTVWINNPPSTVAQYPEYTAGNMTIKDGVWTFYNGSQPDLTVFPNYDYIPLTALGDGLFKGNQSIRSFYPHHCFWFTAIGDEAFADSSVEYVEMFPSITDIGREAFRNCPNITEVTLPGSLISLGEGAYRDCANLTRISIPASLSVIGRDTFSNCARLTELTLPEGLTAIGEGAFRNCESLAELTLPASLTSIDASAFEGCGGVTRLTVLCDPSALPAELFSNLPALREIYAAPDATDEQVRTLTRIAGEPWYTPVPRVGEEKRELIEMPYAMLPEADFWYDDSFARLDQYNGRELNLYLPREIKGVKLTTIGGNMMKRASSKDGGAVELPVRSLIIPENYTEIPYWAFANCSTLETVICYAPIENVQDCLFKGCTSLREVVFVNGVRNLGKYVFAECPSLETVYLGSFVESVNEYTFLNEDGSVSFDQAECVTDPARMPDISVLLTATQTAPMENPVSTDAPAAVQPVGAEGDAYLGAWTLQTVVMDDTPMNASDIGMEMEITLNADGTAILAMFGEEPADAVWTIQDGVAYLDGEALLWNADGTLSATTDGVTMILVRANEAPAEQSAAAVAPSQPDASLGGYVGTWHACYMATGGLNGDPRALYQLKIALVLNEDGTGTIDFPEMESHIWYRDDASGVVYFGEGGDAFDMPLTLLDGGFMRYGNLLDGYMIFSQDPSAVWTDQTAPTQTDARPVASDDPSAPTAPLTGGIENWLERKYICTGADSSGFALSASMLGGEYSFVLHADGALEFVMVGTSVPGLRWTQSRVSAGNGETDGVAIDYFGQSLLLIPTDKGFDMDYFGSMLLHFEPDASVQ